MDEELIAIKKRKLTEETEEDPSKKQKLEASVNDDKEPATAKPDEETKPGSVKGESTTGNEAPSATKSPKKKLHSVKKKIYGNYDSYYNYRCVRHEGKRSDARLQVFDTRKELFMGKEVVDVGCNTGYITIEVAKRYDVNNIVGIDIDKSLIKKANQNIKNVRDAHVQNGTPLRKFPYNVHFVLGNYVLENDVLLECEFERFDVVLCLSLTKWIQLNFGDAGLKQAFRRMFLQLRPGGVLILEAQPYESYKRRKNLTNTTLANYNAIAFMPTMFKDYLLGPEVGFARVEELGVPDHEVKGFQRPIQVFYKN